MKILGFSIAESYWKWNSSVSKSLSSSGRVIKGIPVEGGASAAALREREVVGFVLMPLGCELEELNVRSARRSFSCLLDYSISYWYFY